MASLGFRLSAASVWMETQLQLVLQKVGFTFIIVCRLKLCERFQHIPLHASTLLSIQPCLMLLLRVVGVGMFLCLSDKTKQCSSFMLGFHEYMLNDMLS